MSGPAFLLPMENAPRKPRKRAFRRWLKQQREDLLFLAGCALCLIGTYQISPVATWFVGGLACFVWILFLVLGGKS